MWLRERAVFVAAGLAMVGHEMIIADAPRTELLALAALIMGFVPVETINARVRDAVQRSASGPSSPTGRSSPTPPSSASTSPSSSLEDFREAP